MADPMRPEQASQEGLECLSQGLFASACKLGHVRHTLEIRHQAAPRLRSNIMHTNSAGFGVSLSFDQGREPLPGQRVHCSTAELPFQDKVFSLVLLNHVLSDGTQIELAEAARVLARDGVLVVLGLNQLGWRYRFQNRMHRLPGLSPLKVKFELDRLDMCIDVCAGAGLLGLNRPQLMSSGLAGLGLPLADVIVLRARRNDSPEMTQLRFREKRRGVVQSASLSG